MNNRIINIRKSMEEKNIEALFLRTNEHRISKNVFYLTGFTGEEGICLIEHDKVTLFVDGRFPEQAREEVVDGVDVKLVRYAAVVEEIIASGIKTIGLEESILPHSYYKGLVEKLEGIEPIKADGMVEAFRLIKEEEEIERLREACKCSDDAFMEMLKIVKAGVKERDIAAELEYHMKRLGAKKASFDMIVASGYRGAMAHGVASDKKLENGDFVVFDFGAMLNNYCSDCTRTVVIGEPTDKHKEIYDLVRLAQETAMPFFKPDTPCCEPDKAAREVIKNGGYGDNFNHSLGHGIGLDVHEAPGISSMVPEDKLLMKNMVASNEPGIYLEGWGGVRIEDTVVVRDNGGEPLTKITKDMIVIE
ncbi:MAG TPA: aminopeptidase P family protein [Caldisericia bacterium]|nr:aminopeptidase P family protein [Caldisericia bacterium]HPF48221.1 aminopeptidase P family protein [Caldisericia bacterium]HPI83843.1 aminopeptidase P family protein [Caldisericia bacterium]HPQ92674.1 aminopeptidase P family protein [Caldisericia bacterium]HRV74228.1 aminopeptidase P family protein [Caldisericia bacterium]